MATVAFDKLTLERRDAKRRALSGLYLSRLVIFSAIAVGIIVAIIGTILVRGVPALTWDFLSSAPDKGMTAGGIWPQIKGSLLLMAGTFACVLPVGILGGVYLAEYAGRGRWARLIRGAITSLAGTPAVIFGLFGLAVFVISWKLGFSLLAGWLTLSFFALPVIVLSTENAIKLVPESLTEAALSLGLSRWQVLRRVVLPHALPGIVTGIVLSTGRAAGEATPILLTASVYYRGGEPPRGLEILFKGIENLPYHLAEGYRQGGKIPEKTIWGTCLVLMLLVLTINLGAIIVRARARRNRLA